MKRSTKFMVMTVALIATMLLSMSAFAATVTYEGLSAVEDNGDYDITVTYGAANYSEGDQVTMLVLTGADSIQFAEDGMTPTNVAYIDQQTITAATGTFKFTVAKSFIQQNKVFVKLGATEMENADSEWYSFQTTGDPSVTVTVNTGIANAYGVTGLKVAKVTDIPEGKVVTAAGATVIYASHKDKVSNVTTVYCYILSTGEISAETVSLADGEPTVKVLANTDFDNSGNVNISDATAILNYVFTPSLLQNDEQRFLADVDYNGSVNISDATKALDVIYGGTPGAAN